jgi:hypothetical protein
MRFARFLLSPLCLIPFGVRYSGLSAGDAATVSAVTAVGVSPNNVVGGTSVTLSVMLDANAPFGGSVVNLSYSASSVFTTAPKSVAVPQGQKIASVTVVTKPTGSTAAVTISATLGSSSAQTTLTVRQPQVATIALSKSTVTGPETSTLSLTLDGPAPAGGLTPQIIFSPSSLGQIPSVPRTCPAGLTCGGFPQRQDSTVPPDSMSLRLIVQGVPVRDPRTVNITASVGVPRTVSLQILPPPVTVSFRANCDHGTTIDSTQTLQTVGVQVTTRHSIAASGAYASLTSSPSLGLPATMELTQVNPPNEHFQCVDVTTPTFLQRSTVRVTATSGPTAYSKTLIVVPLALSDFSVSPTVVFAGQGAGGSVRLNGLSPSSGLVVHLTSSDKSVADPPPTVPFPPGVILKYFSFTPVFPASATDSVVSAVITATFAGQSRSDTIFVKRH